MNTGYSSGITVGFDNLPKHLFLALIDQFQGAVFAIQEGRFIYFNQQLVDLFGYTAEELQSRPVFDFVHKEDRAMVAERYAARVHGEKVPGEYLFRLITKGGEVRDINMRIGTVPGEEGAVTTIGSLLDITDKQNTMRALANSQADIESILDNMPDVFYRTDMQGIVCLMSPSVIDALGFQPEQMLGEPLADFYCNPDDREKIVQALIDGNGKAHQVEACLRRRDGGRAWISTNAYIRLDSQMRPICIEGIARNITDRKQQVEELTRLGRYDDLTQCYNRRTFIDETAKQIEIAKRYPHPLSLAMLDLDWFKKINDCYGHQVGDQALRHFADACRSIIRSTDLIGRMGGEEFTLLTPETPGPEAVEMLKRLRRRLKTNPFRGDFGEISLSFSAGLITKQVGEGTPEAMLLRADRLLYQAKEQGRDQVVHEPG